MAEVRVRGVQQEEECEGEEVEVDVARQTVRTSVRKGDGKGRAGRRACEDTTGAAGATSASRQWPGVG